MESERTFVPRSSLSRRRSPDLDTLGELMRPPEDAGGPHREHHDDRRQIHDRLPLRSEEVRGDDLRITEEKAANDEPGRRLKATEHSDRDGDEQRVVPESDRDDPERK